MKLSIHHDNSESTRYISYAVFATYTALIGDSGNEFFLRLKDVTDYLVKRERQCFPLPHFLFTDCVFIQSTHTKGNLMLLHIEL